MSWARVVLWAMLVSMLPQSRAHAADPYDADLLKQRKSLYPENEAAVEVGRKVYLKYCAGCHGDEGKGDGGSAKYLDPKPRSFAKGIFKFRHTKSGELPTDEDLYRSTARGIPATAMAAWGEGRFRLSEQQLWQVVYYVKKLGGEDFKDPDFDPYKQVLEVPEPPGVTPERIAAGKELYSNKNKGACLKCHGEAGRGNGSEAGTHKDDWGDPSLPSDQTKSWRYKKGTTVVDIFRTFSTGLNGTPMPGYGESLSVDERWNLSYYVETLIEDYQLTPGEKTVVAVRTSSIPESPRAEGWRRLPGVDIPMLGQVIVRPRYALPSVDLVTVRAMYDEDEIAVHFTWNDRSKSVVHSSPDKVEVDDTYVPAKTVWARRKLKLRDSLQLQLPTRIRDDGSLPYFYLGGGRGRVALWRWFADREARTSTTSARTSTSAGRAFEERLQNGAQKPPEARLDAEQALTGMSRFDDGQWTLVLRRKLSFDRKRDISIVPGTFVPFAFQVWDGGYGESGPLCAISSWHWLRLDAPTPQVAYWAGAAGFGAMQLLVLLLVWWSRRTLRKTA